MKPDLSRLILLNSYYAHFASHHLKHGKQLSFRKNAHKFTVEAERAWSGPARKSRPEVCAADIMTVYGQQVSL